MLSELQPFVIPVLAILVVLIYRHDAKGSANGMAEFLKAQTSAEERRTRLMEQTVGTIHKHYNALESRCVEEANLAKEESAKAIKYMLGYRDRKKGKGDDEEAKAVDLMPTSPKKRSRYKPSNGSPMVAHEENSE